MKQPPRDWNGKILLMSLKLQHGEGVIHENWSKFV